MRKRELGSNLGWKVSELGLGTWGLSGDGYGPVPEADQDAVIDRAVALGITLFETADSYAGGAMESKLGKRVPKEGYTIVTKIGTDLSATPERKRFEGDYIKEAFERSQTRLDRECIDLVLLHNPSEDALKKGEAQAALQHFVDKGQLKAWGISAGSREVGQTALDEELTPNVIQMAYSAFNTRPLRAVEHTASAQGIGLIIHSVLAYGLLAGMWAPDKTFDQGDHRKDRWTTDQLRARVHQLKALRAGQTGSVTTNRQVALRFALENPRVGCALIGPRNTIQLDQLIRDAGKPPYLEEYSKRNLTRRLTEMGVR